MESGVIIDLSKVVPLDVGPNNYVGVNDLNSQFVVGGTGSEGFIYDWVAQKLTLIPPLPGYKSAEAHGINSKNDVVGSMDDHAFVWSAGKSRDLGPGSLRDINDDGFAAGALPGGSLPLKQIPAWVNCSDRNPALKPILLPAGYTSGVAFAINKNGTIVGSLGSGEYAFVYDLNKPNDPALDLNSLIQPNFGYYTLQDALDINDNGEIVGTAEGGSPPGPAPTVLAYVLRPRSKGTPWVQKGTPWLNPPIWPNIWTIPIYQPSLWGQSSWLASVLRNSPIRQRFLRPSARGSSNRAVTQRKKRARRPRAS
jgi:hypothetical protein